MAKTETKTKTKAEAIPRFKPGDRVWRFSQNRRVYINRDGTNSIGPVYREHFVSYRVSEVRGSQYLLQSRYFNDYINSITLPIKEVDREWKSDQERDDMIWHDERYRISEAVRSCDLTKLREVAAILGYTPDLEP